jgi:hypothetical protein
LATNRDEIRKLYKDSKIRDPASKRYDSKERLEVDQKLFKAEVAGISQKLRLLEAFNLD